MKRKPESEEARFLQSEINRLQSYIDACRIRFGDAAVNSAITELVIRPRWDNEESNNQKWDRFKARQFNHAQKAKP